MHHDLLAWGASLQYPKIVLNANTGEYLHPGEQSWRDLLTSENRERIAQLQKRYEYWRSKTRLRLV